MLISEHGSGFHIDMETDVSIEELVREYTLAVYKKYKCRAIDTASALGIGYPTLYIRLKRYRENRKDGRTIAGRAAHE